MVVVTDNKSDDEVITAPVKGDNTAEKAVTPATSEEAEGRDADEEIFNDDQIQQLQDIVEGAVKKTFEIMDEPAKEENTKNEEKSLGSKKSARSTSSKKSILSLLSRKSNKSDKSKKSTKSTKSSKSKKSERQTATSVPEVPSPVKEETEDLVKADSQPVEETPAAVEDIDDKLEESSKKEEDKEEVADTSRDVTPETVKEETAESEKEPSAAPVTQKSPEPEEEPDVDAEASAGMEDVPLKEEAEKTEEKVEPSDDKNEDPQTEKPQQNEATEPEAKPEEASRDIKIDETPSSEKGKEKDTVAASTGLFCGCF